MVFPDKIFCRIVFQKQANRTYEFSTGQDWLNLSFGFISATEMPGRVKEIL